MKVKPFLITSILILITSCTSFPSKTNYEDIPQEQTIYKITLDKITININLLNESELEEQVKNIMTSVMFKEINIPEFDDELFLSVQINQRAYTQGINQYNSIYLNYQLQNSNGKVVLNNCYFNKLQDSIDSSKLQYKLISLISSDIKKFIKKSEKK